MTRAPFAVPMKVVGIGAGGHCKVLLESLRLRLEFEVVGLTEASGARPQALLGVPVLGGDDLLPELFRQGVRHAFLGVGAVGDNHPRAAIFERIRALGFQFINVIHPAAIISSSAVLGEGVAIMAGAIVNADTKVGNNVILNTGAILEHDCVLGDHVHVAPGAILSGGARVGMYSHVGAGAVVRQNAVVGANALVGAGAVVVDDVPDGVAVAGVPARPLARHASAPRGAR